MREKEKGNMSFQWLSWVEKDSGKNRKSGHNDLKMKPIHQCLWIQSEKSVKYSKTKRPNNKNKKQIPDIQFN